MVYFPVCAIFGIQWRCSSVYTMRMHLAVPAATHDISRKTEQSVRKRREKKQSLFIISITINNRWQCYLIFSQFYVWELSHPVQYFCGCYNRWRWALFLSGLPIVCRRKLNKLFIQPAGQKQGQRDPSGHQRRTKTDSQASQTFSQNSYSTPQERKSGFGTFYI